MKMSDVMFIRFSDPPVPFILLDVISFILFPSACLVFLLSSLLTACFENTACRAALIVYTPDVTSLSCVII